MPGDLIWDDGFLVKENPLIKSPILVFEAFRQYLLAESLSVHYRPVQTISYMLDYWLWHSNTFGYHLSNVLWHTGSGLLLFLLLKQLLPSLLFKSSSQEQHRVATLVAFLLALLWVVHPVHSAAVDYISGRADSLAFFFSCGAWLLYLRARRVTRPLPRAALFAGAAVSLLLGLCSRESACMWVVVFLLHLFFFERALSRRARVLLLASCVVIMGAYAGLRQLPERRSAPMPGDGWSAPVRGVLMLRALGDYGRLMVFPANLYMERSVVNSPGWKDNPGWRRTVASDYLTILGLLVLAGLIAGAARRGTGRPLRAFGAGWFLLAYLPISNVVDLNATVAEHWLYLPSVGFLLFLAGVAVDLPRTPRTLAIALGCVAVLALGARSYIRSSDWVDDKTFYTRTGKAGGGSIRILLNLGQIYGNEGDYARAETFYRRALDLYPDYLIARNNLAHVLMRQGRNEEGEHLLREASAAAPTAARHFPRTWAAALNLAKMHVRNEEPETALQLLGEARKNYPAVWPLLSLEADLLRRTRGPAAALPAVEEFRQGRWWHMEAAIAAGKLYYELGRIDEAQVAFRRASRLDIHDATALNQLALMAMNQSRLPEAYAMQRRAIARQPDEPRQYLMLTSILEKMGRTEEANALLGKVSRMQAMAQAHTAAD